MIVHVFSLLFVLLTIARHIAKQVELFSSTHLKADLIIRPDFFFFKFLPLCAHQLKNRHMHSKLRGY